MASKGGGPVQGRSARHSKERPRDSRAGISENLEHGNETDKFKGFNFGLGNPDMAESTSAGSGDFAMAASDGYSNGTTCSTPSNVERMNVSSVEVVSSALMDDGLNNRISSERKRASDLSSDSIQPVVTTNNNVSGTSSGRRGGSGVVTGNDTAGGNVIRQRSPGQASLTIQELPPSSPLDLRRQPGEGTPILRLSVHPQTSEVTRSARTGRTETFGADFSGLPPEAMEYGTSSPDLDGMRLQGLSLAGQRTTRTVQREGFEETLNNSDEGRLSWGVKRAYDGTWEERWAQQNTDESTEEAPGRSGGGVFGQAQGQNIQTNERWISRWEETSAVRRVQRAVQQDFDDNHGALQEWQEEEVTHKEGNYMTTQKEGKDMTGRQVRKWRQRNVKRPEDTETGTGLDGRRSAEEIDSIVNAATAEGGEEEDIVKLLRPGEVWDEFEEAVGSETRGRRVLRDSQGQDIYETRWRTNGRVTEFSWTQYRLGGNVRGFATGIDEHGDKWEEEWDSMEDGTGQKTRIIKRDGEVVGEREGKVKITSEEGNEGQNLIQAHGERWQEVTRDNIFEKFREEWWEDFGGEKRNAWGEKKSEKVYLSEQESESRTAKRIHVSEGCWYDNGTEEHNDTWETIKELEHDTSVGESEGPLYRVSSERHRGNKRGKRHDDGTEWGEQWEEDMEGSFEDKNVGETVVRILIKTKNGYEDREVRVETKALKRERRFDDRWWKEPTGNSWGHKTETSGERNFREEWFDSGKERQVDRWEILPDGSRRGEKYGSKEGGCSWEERWSSGDGGHFLEKKWEEPEGDRMHAWGEGTGGSGTSEWKRSWRRSEAHDGGEDFVEEWNSDGCGNSQAKKQGRSWRKGADGSPETTSWFDDRFGSVGSRAEQWAWKRGANEVGDVWEDKWNECPEIKTAEKRGSNARGDAWEERWRETFDNGTKSSTWAEKKGSNAQGESWQEMWDESAGRKYAQKECWKLGGGFWGERWGEEFSDDGGGEKWCQKWNDDGNGGRCGKSWGDRWGPDGAGGHRWGEEWNGDNIRKWAHDTPGRPEGC